MRYGRFMIFGALLVTVFFTGVFFRTIQNLALPHTTYFKLAQPLRIGSEDEASDFQVLPIGTPLYKDRSFPEGHTRYIVYVNVKDVIALEHVESDKAALIDPIWAYAVQP